MIRFNIDKTIQAAAFLIKRKPGQREDYMRLLKLLYIADRQSLKERGAPLCGDTPWAMKKGPVPGTTLDLINGKAPASGKWEEFIQTVDYDVQLKSDPGNLQLSRAELNILECVAEQFRSFDEWDMVDWCHANIPEYEKNWNARGTRQRRRIPLSDVLEAIGRLEDMPSILEQINADTAFSRLFSDHMPAVGK